MSTNCNKLQYSPKEEQKEATKIEIPSPNHEIQSEFLKNRGDSDRGEEEEIAKINGGEENCEGEITSSESENSVPEEDDGFRTPTSIDHKIPPITECPSPPRKIRAHCSLKRPQSVVHRLLFIAAAEAESILPPMGRDNVEERRLKKARTANGDEI